MPHALSEKQKKYIQFIREYIRENEAPPSLDLIAKHFRVRRPTAHKTLDVLEKKGALLFGRERTSDHYIRLSERGGGREKIFNLPIIGKVNEYGEIVEFPENHGAFPIVLTGVSDYTTGALEVTVDIPQERILIGDYLVVEFDRRPQPSDIAVMNWGSFSNRLFLCKTYALSYDQDLETIEAANFYAMPEDLLDEQREQRLFWYPLLLDESNEAYYLDEMEQNKVPDRPIPSHLLLGTVLLLRRKLR